MDTRPDRSTLAGTLAALLVAAACATPRPASAQADPVVQDTVLDAGFGGDGRVTLPIDLRPGHDVAERVVADNLGGYWVVGRAETAGTQRNKHFVLAAARLARDGTVAALAVRNDLVIDLESQQFQYFEVEAVAADAQGRLLLSVGACTGSAVDACSNRVLRILADGSPDAGFDGDGEVRLPMASGFYRGIVARSNGETWVGGSTSNPTVSRIFRFGPGGEALAPLPASHSFLEFAPLPDDRLMARAGTIEGAATLVLLDSRGVPDPAYGVEGRVVVPDAAGDCGRAQVVQAAARFSVLPDRRALLRIDLRSQADRAEASFVVGIGANGEVGAARCIAHLDPELDGLAASVSDVALRDDGRAFVALPVVKAAGGDAMGLRAFRLQPNGELADDAGFHGGQAFPIAFPPASGSTDAYAAAMLIDRGAPLLVGSARLDAAGGYDFALARLRGSARVFRGSFE